jgi:nucleoside-diphosphate kinase
VGVACTAAGVRAIIIGFEDSVQGETVLERTLVLIKPDAIQRALVGRIIGRFEDKGLKIVGIKFTRLSDSLLNEHYSHLADKPFFPGTKAFMQSTPVVAICLEGLECVETVRRLCGITKSREAAPGTIRGDLAMSVQANLVHASDSVETAVREVARFFTELELLDYDSAQTGTIYSPDELK